MKKSVAIYNPFLETKGGGEKVCLALAEVLSKQGEYDVTLLTHNNVILEELEKYFNLDLSKTKVIHINFETKGVRLLHKTPLPGKLRSLFLDLKIHRTLRKYNFDIFINCCYQSNLPNPSPIGVYMCMFPQVLIKPGGLDPLRITYLSTMNILYRIFMYPKYKNAIETYQIITANSHYTQEHIKKRWGRDSCIIYPICENMRLKKGEIYKKKMILNVGRFFANSGENHHKRQDVLLKTFSEMTDLHKAGWELHFAGSVAEDVSALKYILKLIKEGQSLPVFFHFNASFDELKELYNQATIYWHATGYGSNSTQHPEKQEHFGITTVEAMSAGCIPIVIDSAGQKETVYSGKNGFLWTNLGELEKFTRKISALNNRELEIFRQSSLKSAQKYNAKSFEREILDLMTKV